MSRLYVQELLLLELGTRDELGWQPRLESGVARDGLRLDGTPPSRWSSYRGSAPAWMMMADRGRLMNPHCPCFGVFAGHPGSTWPTKRWYHSD